MKNYLIFFGGLFLALLAHDAQLYPQLEAMDLVTLAILRIALLLIPLIGMTVAMRAKTQTIHNWPDPLVHLCAIHHLLGGRDSSCS